MLRCTGLVSAMVNAEVLLGRPYSFGKWYSLDLKDLSAGAVVWKEDWLVKLLSCLRFDTHDVHFARESWITVLGVWMNLH